MGVSTHQLQNDGERSSYLSPAFAGAHAWCNEKMALAANLADAVPLAEFFSSGALERALSTYAGTKQGCDLRVAASMWSLYYFSALAIPYILARTVEGQVLPIDFDAMTLSLAPDGLPSTFGVRDVGVLEDLGGGDVFSVVGPLVEKHLRQIVEQLRTRTGIAPRLAWNNAAVYIDYALRNSWTPTGNATVDQLVECPRIQDGVSNPFYGCLRFEQEDGQTVCRRKVCCLRYMIPGIPSCGSLCALPNQRMQ
ncbi:siderophore-iron reductase FhuF [Rhizobiaceae bacterium n13]|uniref:Siderophore-iron reductase FhuF n=1 Tax=Ferirhizobium litorale TaxID=2927786 RepID=A0AAE3QES5_9HYPH|nr:siderophore-iron reductase FhuF [Fererhizobium litorale]MDI7861784.1 siderophore-iron reductase FhuF [Fererhizobium litorale]MDI7921874.1 siderophore-iron reductase FhuF [Fererhizobium litorale]